MPTLDDHETRLTAVEAALFRPVSGLADTHMLAAHASQEAGDAKVAGRVVNALRETQLEHSERLDRIETRLDGIETRLDGIETTMKTVTAGQQQILTLLNRALGEDGESGTG